MANSRAEELQHLLGSLNSLITPDNRKSVETIISGMLHPESHHQNSSVIDKLITHKFNTEADTSINRVLTQVNKLLRDDLKNSIHEFDSSHVYYNLLNNFWHQYQTYLINLEESGQNTLISVIQNAVIYYQQHVLAIKLQYNYTSQTNQIPTFLDLNQIYISNILCYAAIPFELEILISTIKDSHLKATYQEFILKTRADILMSKYETLYMMSVACSMPMNMTGVYNQNNTTILDTCINACTLELFGLDTNLPLKNYHQLGDQLSEILDKIKVQQAAIVTQSRSRTFLISSHSRNEQNAPAKVLQHAHAFGLPVNRSVSSLEKQLTFDGRIPKEDMILAYAKYTEPTDGHLSHDNAILHMAECFFDKAIESKAKDLRALERIPFQDHHLERLYLALTLIPQGMGLYNLDSNPIRTFHFIRFINKIIIDLKHHKLPKQSEEPHFIAELDNALEKAFMVLLQMGHGDDQNKQPLSRGLAIDIHLTDEKIKYYKLVCREQYLFLAGDIITQFARLEKTTFRSEKIRVCLKKYFAVEQDHVAGIFDLLINAASKLNQEICAAQFYQAPQVNAEPSNQADDNSDEHYSALLAELDVETKAIEAAATKELAKHKETHKAKIKETNKKSAKFFQHEESMSNILPKPSFESECYYKAGRLRQTGFENSMPHYLEAVQRYLDADRNLDKDYFYIAASLAELADCYTRKGLNATPQDYLHEACDFAAILAWYEKAFDMAQAANRCFLEEVEPRAEEYSEKNELKNFKDLADHIHSTLKMTEKKLKFIREKQDAYIDKLQYQQDVLEQNRLKAKARKTHDEWIHNPQPSNFYRNIYVSNQDKIDKLRKTSSCIFAFLDKKLTPLKANFAYLAGAACLPLAASSVAKIKSATASVSNGKGEFGERLKVLAQTDRLLKGDSSAETFRYRESNFPPLLKA